MVLYLLIVDVTCVKSLRSSYGVVSPEAWYGKDTKLPSPPVCSHPGKHIFLLKSSHENCVILVAEKRLCCNFRFQILKENQILKQNYVSRISPPPPLVRSPSSVATTHALNPLHLLTLLLLLHCSQA